MNYLLFELHSIRYVYIAVISLRQFKLYRVSHKKRTLFNSTIVRTLNGLALTSRHSKATSKTRNTEYGVRSTIYGAPLYVAVEKPKSFMINYTFFNLIIITNFIIISKDSSLIRFK